MSDKYGTEQDAHYCYPNSNVLVNKLGLTDALALQTAEIELTVARLEHFVPNFDDMSLGTLQAIHFHLFQDLYDWAGMFRTVDISIGRTRFANVSRIEAEGEKLFRQFAAEGSLIGLPRAEFSYPLRALLQRA